MKLSKKIKKNKGPAPICSAIDLYNTYMEDVTNFELPACTNTAIENYDTLVDARISFARCMLILRDSSEEEGGDVECIRRLREIKQLREGVVQRGGLERAYSDKMEENWLNINYMMKKWRRFKQAYHFSNGLMKAMADTDKQGFVADVLQYLPFPSFYIDLSNYDGTIDMGRGEEKYLGCFINISVADKAEDRAPAWIIRQMFCTEGANNFTGSAVYPKGVKTTIRDGLPEGSEQEIEEEEHDVSSLVINLIAYIASTNADIEKATEPTPKPYRGGKAPSHGKAPVTNWNVGFRIGPAIEKAFSKMYAESGSGTTGNGHSSPRPHIRAAHWHNYWTGPKGNQKLSLRWVSQAFVNCTDSENLPVVEHRDRGDEVGQ